MFKKSLIASLLSGILPLLFTLAVMAVIFVGIQQAGDSGEAEGIRLLEEALMRVAIHSYAVNGYFPATVDYIIDNFAVYVDRTRFVVHYVVFADNMLPDIRVFPLTR
ncbi:MAG: hypothetical protein FWC71_10205 [Defluviitaleaceae bacterium]|nr:hypothetical protein [Defluviitaleaceae bacterium]